MSPCYFVRGPFRRRLFYMPKHANFRFARHRHVRDAHISGVRGCLIIIIIITIRFDFPSEQQTVRYFLRGIISYDFWSTILFKYNFIIYIHNYFHVCWSNWWITSRITVHKIENAFVLVEYYIIQRTREILEWFVIVFILVLT